VEERGESQRRVGQGAIERVKGEDCGTTICLDLLMEESNFWLALDRPDAGNALRGVLRENRILDV